MFRTVCYWKPISLDCNNSDKGTKNKSKVFWAKQLKWHQKKGLVFVGHFRKNKIHVQTNTESVQCVSKK